MINLKLTHTRSRPTLSDTVAAHPSEELSAPELCASSTQQRIADLPLPFVHSFMANHPPQPPPPPLPSNHDRNRNPSVFSCINGHHQRFLDYTRLSAEGRRRAEASLVWQRERVMRVGGQVAVECVRLRDVEGKGSLGTVYGDGKGRGGEGDVVKAVGKRNGEDGRDGNAEVGERGVKAGGCSGDLERRKGPRTGGGGHGDGVLQTALPVDDGFVGTPSGGSGTSGCGGERLERGEESESERRG